MRNLKVIIILTVLSLSALSISIQAERLQPARAVANKIATSPQTLTVKAEEFSYGYTPSVPVKIALDGGSRQGGDVIGAATLIASLPYLDTGTTTGYTDDYDAQCPNASTSPDVIYYYIPSSNERIHIWSCESAFWTKLYVYQNSDTLAGDEIACNQYSDSCTSNPFHAVIYDLAVTADDTFYIVVDGFGGQEGEYVLYVESRPPIDTINIHPALANNGLGVLVNSYEWYEYETFMPWWSSVDNGDNWDGGYGFDFSGGTATYPSVDYWRDDSAFCGSLVPPVQWNNGAPNYVVDIPSGYDLSSMGGRFWDWSAYGWHDMAMVDIACAETDSTWQWGMQSMIHSTTYTSPAMVNGPHIFYPTDGEGFASIGWLIDESGNPMGNCVSTVCDIDRSTLYGYAIYDHLNDSLGLYEMIAQMENVGELFDPAYTEIYTFIMDDSTNIMYPAVASYGGNVIIVCENYDGLDPDDKDLICFNTQSILVSTLVTSDVAVTADPERFPRVQHISGASFLCTYIKNNELYAILTEDGGLTWGTPEVISLPGDSVVEDYRAVDIAESDGYAVKIMYEYQETIGRGAGSTWLRLITYQVYAYPDADSDGVPDFADNCPGDYNPGQDDGDVDGIGNVCDNCPGQYNPDQADGDADGVGNLCDNCPEDYNPLQEDENENGVGDACEWVCGDINDNGLINILDVTYLIAYLYQQGPPPPHLDAADVNNNDLINILDVTYLLAYLYMQGPAPNCG